MDNWLKWASEELTFSRVRGLTNSREWQRKTSSGTNVLPAQRHSNFFSPHFSFSVEAFFNLHLNVLWLLMFQKLVWILMKWFRLWL